MDSIAQEQELSETEERLHWQGVERSALAFCEPLSRMIDGGRKKLMGAVDVSEGQLSRELSPNYDNRLSLSVALYIGKSSQDERLARTIVCDGLGMQMPDWQKRRVAEKDEFAALRAECRDAGPVGELLLERAKRRARSSR